MRGLPDQFALHRLGPRQTGQRQKLGRHVRALGIGGRDELRNAEAKRQAVIRAISVDNRGMLGYCT